MHRASVQINWHSTSWQQNGFLVITPYGQQKENENFPNEKSLGKWNIRSNPAAAVNPFCLILFQIPPLHIYQNLQVSLVEKAFPCETLLTSLKLPETKKKVKKTD